MSEIEIITDGDRPERTHDGKVVMMRSNLRWCSDGLEFTCWNIGVQRDYVRVNASNGKRRPKCSKKR